MKGTKNKISFIPMIIILMLFVQMIIPITIYASPETMVKTTGTMNISLRRNTNNQNQVDVVAMDTTYEIEELKYVKKETGAVDVSYFEEAHSDIIDFKIKPASKIETSFELSGYGTYTVYAKNSKGDRFLSSITIANPEDAPDIIVKKKEDQKLTIQVQVKSNKYQIEEIKIARKENVQDTIDFSKEGEEIEFVKSKNVSFSYTATQAGIYVIYAKDSQKNAMKLTTYIYDEFPIQAEVSDAEEGSRKVTIEATDSICDIVKIKVALKSEINDINDFQTKGTELDIKKGKNVELSYSAPKDGTYKFYIEDEAGFKKMVEKRIAKDAYVTINVEQVKDNPKKVTITAENKLADIVLMKVKIGDNLTIEDVKQTGTEIKITKGKKVTASYEVEQNCTLNVYIKDEEDYGAMVRKTITGINNPEDTTKPTITGVQNNGIYANDVTPVVKDEHLKEVIVKKDQKQISYQNGAKLSEEGKYEITAIDEAGNKTVVSFIIDKTAPSITETISEPVNGVVTVKVLSQDNLTQIETIKAATGKYDVDYFQNNGHALAISKIGKTAEGEFKIIANGTYTIYAEDMAGNKKVKTIEITTIEQEHDTEKPQITYTKKLEEDKVNVEISVVDNQSEIKTIKAAGGKQDLEYFESQGQALEIKKEGVKASASFYAKTNGIYTIYAEDMAGNKEMIEVEVTEIGQGEQEDKEKPEIIGVEDGKIYEDSVTPLVKDEHLTEVILKKDNQIVENYQNGDTISEEGSYELTARDESGNETTVKFTIKKEEKPGDGNQDPDDGENNDGNNTDGNGTNNNGNNNSSDNGNQSTILGNGNKDTSTTNQIIPKAGRTGVILIVAILGLSVFAIISYIRYRKIK
ncbi:MAG TPA: hypothetical protein IAB70_00795 [Candidatus Merdicola faecigallinarum]|uniref:Uncharacterized protein n=1 Tax=Candidatus Merdicola faecigallinarum TaxID=2840862 RepID=A0A9D1S8U4_9FIRM|nr:hypothetical protein [Candidatus Merdicola faecigallinarum]